MLEDFYFDGILLVIAQYTPSVQCVTTLSFQLWRKVAMRLSSGPHLPSYHLHNLPQQWWGCDFKTSFVACHIWVCLRMGHTAYPNCWLPSMEKIHFPTGTYYKDTWTPQLGTRDLWVIANTRSQFSILLWVKFNPATKMCDIIFGTIPNSDLNTKNKTWRANQFWGSSRSLSTSWT